MGFVPEKYCIYFFYIEVQKAFEISTDYITLIRIRNLPGVILVLVTESWNSAAVCLPNNVSVEINHNQGQLSPFSIILLFDNKKLNDSQRVIEEAKKETIKWYAPHILYFSRTSTYRKSLKSNCAFDNKHTKIWTSRLYFV